MSLTQEQVKHIANLSRLQLEWSDIDSYLKDLNSIVDYIDVLSWVPEEELNSVSEDVVNELPLREDIITSEVKREELLACSPKKIINNQISINNIMH